MLPPSRTHEASCVLSLAVLVYSKTPASLPGLFPSFPQNFSKNAAVSSHSPSALSSHLYYLHPIIGLFLSYILVDFQLSATFLYSLCLPLEDFIYFLGLTICVASTTEIYFLSITEARNLRLRCQQKWSLLRPLFLAVDGCLLPVSSKGLPIL